MIRKCRRWHILLKSMRTRLKDIAEELNVSVNTVSRALRGETDISKEMRQRISRVAERLHYQPNLMARSLVTGQSAIFGLVVPDLLNPFFAELAKSVGAALRENAHDLILASSDGDPLIEQAEIRAMLARSVDALLIASCQRKQQSLYQIYGERTPIVLIDRPLPWLRASFIGGDDVYGGKLATEHLIELGRKRIAYIGSPDLRPVDRFHGFRHALRSHNIEIRENLILPLPAASSPDDEIGYELMQTIFKRRLKPDGVFCHNDLMAIGAMRATLEAGFAVPDDIAFVGFDNVHYSKYLHIPLTSIDQRSAEIGATAAQLALELAARGIQEPRTILLEPKLVIRQSTVGITAPRHRASPQPTSKGKKITAGGSVDSFAGKGKGRQSRAARQTHRGA